MKNLLIIPLVFAGLALFVVGPAYGFLARVFTDFRPWGWLYDLGRRASFMASILAELLLSDILLKPNGYPFGHIVPSTTTVRDYEYMVENGWFPSEE